MSRLRKPLMLTGLQPTGQLMIGNYLGAVKNWVELQATHEAFLILADLHAITVPQEPEGLRQRSFELAALFAACGVDFKKSAVFMQSHVPAHTQLLWVLNCVVPMGELQRMTQFKDKAGQAAATIHVGLFDYPVLMAADILLYGADLVPVGDDQQQHMEFTRRMARKFNAAYGEIFKIPEMYKPRRGARLMGLQTPTAKMSKSDPNTDNFVALLDPPEEVRRKIRIAVTDSGSEVRRDAAKPGISNLITLYAAVAGEGEESIENRYAGKGYAVFKKDLAERIVEFLKPIQDRFRSIAPEKDMLAEVLRRGADQARGRSEATLARVYQAVGFIPGRPAYRRPPGLRGSALKERPDIPAPAAARALHLHTRRNAMESEERKELTPAAAAESDADAECIPDCCVCCCCDTDEECSMEA